MKNRLDHLRQMIKTHRVFYSRYNPGSDLLYDVEEADEDYHWMIHEIESLRLENERLKEFVAYTRREMEKELKQSGSQGPPPPRDRGKTNKKFKAK